jgi:hypothetical protein
MTGHAKSPIKSSVFSVASEEACQDKCIDESSFVCLGYNLMPSRNLCALTDSSGKLGPYSVLQHGAWYCEGLYSSATILVPIRRTCALGGAWEQNALKIHRLMRVCGAMGTKMAAGYKMMNTQSVSINVTILNYCQTKPIHGMETLHDIK